MMKVENLRQRHEAADFFNLIQFLDFVLIRSYQDRRIHSLGALFWLNLILRQDVFPLYRHSI